jgi:hypothetical protein
VTRFIYNCAVGIISAILITLAFSITLEAQTASIRLEGTVWDPAGNLLSGATLTAVEEERGFTAEVTSNEDGDYMFLALQPGTYTVTVKAKGFKDVVHYGLALIKPGVVEEIFTIEAAAVNVEASNQERPRFSDSETSTALSKRELEALPLRDRNPLAQIIYQPGIQIQAGEPGSSTVNGTRKSMNSAIMDGISITDPLSPRMDASLISTSLDSISEVQIVTSGGKAEYGRSGGAQFLLIPRSGTKSWTGNFYDYFKNSKLNANEYFNIASGLLRPKDNRNIFGGTLSGPVFGQKTLVFANFEGNRTDQAKSRVRLVLTPEAKAGLFRWYAPDDTSRSTLLSYDIAANDPRHLGIDPTVANILKKLPEPNFASIGDNLNTWGYRFNSPAYLDQERVNARIDHSLNPNQQLFLNLNWSRSKGTDIYNDALATFPNQLSGIAKNNFWGFSAGFNWILNPRMVNEFRVGYLQPKTDLIRPARSTGPMILANTWSDPLDSSYPRSFNSKLFQASDTMSQGRNKHVYKYGIDFQYVRQGSVDYSGVYPNVTLGLDSGNAAPESIGPSEQLDISTEGRQAFERLYNDLLGRIESVSQTYNSSLNSVLPAGTPKNRAFAFQEYSAFLQDDWRITPNITLNLGLRYELGTVPDEKNGFQSVLNQADKISASANISSFKFLSGDWRNKSLKDFAPRAGFAWDIFGSGGTVLRGSYGIYYDRLIGSITNFIDNNSYGFSQTVTRNPNLTGTDVRLRDGIPAIAQPAVPVLQLPDTRSTSVAVFDPNLRTPRIDQYNLTLEKKWGKAVFEAGYVGSRGRRLFQYVNLNQTKTQGSFLQAFLQLQAYRNNGTSVPASNPFIRLFGSPLAALNAVGGSNVDANLVGVVADTMDRGYYANYASAGISDFYIRNFPQFNNFIVGTDRGNSWYNSLQAGMRASGDSYHVRANYTWSKSLDTMSSDGDGLALPYDSVHPESDKAPSDFDRTHVLNFAWDYRIPVGSSLHKDSNMPKWLDGLIGNWNFGILYLWESGQRFSISSGSQTAFAGINSLVDYSGSRYVGNHFKLEGVDYWFNTDQAAAFTIPEAGMKGTSGRNSFTGPSYSNIDLSLFKSFLIRDRQSLQFRVEAYNLTNKVRWGLPDTNIQDSNFGVISSTVGTPRSLQMALRYKF